MKYINIIMKCEKTSLTKSSTKNRNLNIGKNKQI